MQKKELTQVHIGGLSDQNEENDLILDNEEKSDASSLYSVLSQIAYNNCQFIKKQMKNMTANSNNKI